MLARSWLDASRDDRLLRSGLRDLVVAQGFRPRGTTCDRSGRSVESVDGLVDQVAFAG